MTNLDKILNMPFWDVLRIFSPDTYAVDDVCRIINCGRCPVSKSKTDECKNKLEQWLESEVDNNVFS